jgi:hypothetical protein
MDNAYLIAHKVRGESAFDIAHRIDCPSCRAMGCFECDNLGYWWIVSTSGHRAHPYEHQPLFELIELADWGEMPTDAIEHFPTSATPAAPKINLAAALGIAKPQVIITRRL